MKFIRHMLLQRKASSVLFAGPAPGTALLVGIPTLVTLSAKVDGDYDVSLDPDYASVLATITVSGGSGSGWIQPARTDAAKSRLYTRASGGGPTLTSRAFLPVSKRTIEYHRTDLGLTNYGSMGAIFDLQEVGGAVATEAAGPNGETCWRYYPATGGYHRTPATSPLPYQGQPFHSFIVCQYIDGGNAIYGSSSDRLVVTAGQLNFTAGANNILTGTVATNWNVAEWVPWGTLGGARVCSAADYQDGPAYPALSVSAWARTTLGGYGAGSSRSGCRIIEEINCDGVCTDAERAAILASLALRYPGQNVVVPSSSYYDVALPAASVEGMHIVACLGQSNIEGRVVFGCESFNANTYVLYQSGRVAAASHPYDAATNGCWSKLYDTDAAQSCIAEVANDLQPLLGGDLLLIPCCLGGTGNVDWAPTAGNAGIIDSPATLYGGSAHRVRQMVNQGASLDATLYWRFENELAGTGLATYLANTLALIDAWQAEFPGKPFFIVLGRWTGCSESNYNSLNADINTIVATRDNVYKILIAETADIHYTAAEGAVIAPQISTAMAAILAP